MNGTDRDTKMYLAWRVGSRPNPVVDVLALAMGEGLQVDRVPASEARRYAIKRVACESCFSEGATRGVETDGGSTLLCETCAARAGGVQYERHDTGLLPGDGPVVALILSAMSVADEVGCGPSEALGLLDRAHCRVVCGLMRFVPRRHSILPGLDLNDRLVELLGVVVGRSDEAAAFLREQMAAQLHRYEEEEGRGPLLGGGRPADRRRDVPKGAGPGAASRVHPGRPPGAGRGALPRPRGGGGCRYAAQQPGVEAQRPAGGCVAASRLQSREHRRRPDGTTQPPQRRIR